ncbi:sucrase-isomaltase, intestinal-like isoform X3 [Haliotis rufescens]|uniref:sucrase-isomaltase, intestinal-like isoform X3 n=1 Tax=Haliotis rufescens TaxID=6454 RepID=UPI00201EC987|nr:sucrase-isomaltase, intestinal-like isoform X3 [Haliotis rufescens]
MTGDAVGGSTAKRKIAFAVFLVVCLAVALTVGLVLNFLEEEVQPAEIGKRSDVIVDCHPESDASEEKCKTRGCVWAPVSDDRAPKCKFPAGYGYRIVGDVKETPMGMRIELERTPHPQYLTGSASIDNIYLDVEFQTDARLRFRFYPKNGTRWELPDSVLNITSPSTKASETSRLYNVTILDDPVFGVLVTRTSDNQTVFNTTLPGFVYSDQYLQLTTRLASDNVYGFGEHNHRQLRHDLGWKTWSIFTRDVAPVDGWNLYGAHPTYMNVEDGGSAHMVFLKNSNAMEVFLQPSPHPAITFRTIGGVLDFYIFLGPSPGEAVQQYTEAVGRPVMPPYWTLGFHLCRWGYTNITDLRVVIDRNREAGIPYDAQWVDVEYMYNKFVFSYDRDTFDGLPDLVRDLHDHNQKFVVIVDPGLGNDPNISRDIRNNSPGYDVFNDGVREGVLVMTPNNSGPLVAEVWPGATGFPDFTNPKTEAWWEKWARYFRNNESIEFDSLWIDMNEPASFIPGSVDGCEKNKWNNPPYTPNILGRGEDGRMYDKTLCMDSRHHLDSHYNVHSLYAHTQAIQTYNALANIFPGKRPWTMTRSSFAGTGKYATKWMGDNQSRWEQMKWSIIGILEFGFFGFSLNGADICGFWYEAEYEMCVRWHQLGAFYPFARNHNALGDASDVFKKGASHRILPQDPAAWDARFIRLAKEALVTRYRLLPYFYTLMHNAHARGDTVMRPLLFEFPDDPVCLSVDEQFLLGSALLVSPVLYEGKTSVKAYFPEANWYDYFQGEKVAVKKDHLDLYTPLEKFNLHVRGGHVIPWQVPANTTHASRQNNMGAIVALDEEGRAQGELFWDDGENIDTYENKQYSLIKFGMTKAGQLHVGPTVSGSGSVLPLLDMLDIYGLKTIPLTVTLDGEQVPVTNIRQSFAIIQLQNLNMTLTANHTITWS